MSKWFKHYHCWRQKTDVTVIDPETKKNSMILMLEECHCGAVRQIEYKPGQAPIVRTTEVASGNP